VHPFASAFAAAVAVSISAPLIAPAPAQASVVYLPATDELKFVSDGNPGIYVEYGVGKRYLLWNDDSARIIFEGEDNNGITRTWSMWDEDWGPRSKPIALAMRKWREHPTEKQMATIKPEDRQKWTKDMFATANSPKRYPAGQSSSTPAQDTYRPPALNADGCPAGKNMVYVSQSTGFLGLGKKKAVAIGCMTTEELNRWNIEQQNSRPQTPYIPPTYQAPRNCTSNIYGNQVFTNCY
jgi:hypothetical protein